VEDRFSVDRADYAKALLAENRVREARGDAPYPLDETLTAALDTTAASVSSRKLIGRIST
jgi:chromosome partitioning protein